MTENCAFNIDKVIQKLLASPKNPYLTEEAIRQVCFRSRDLFYQQPLLLKLQAPIKICGDIHGQFPDLLNIFNTQGHPDISKYLFIGDYVDRGKQSLQTMTLLLAYKVKYPQKIYLLRGNHQCSQINRLYGFYDQCKRKYSTKIWRLFTDVFNSMPVSAIIDQKIFCVHGGLSPQLRNLKQINRIQRPIQVSDEGLLCDLLWSDPDKYIQGWQKSSRGVSYVFGKKVIDNFLKKYDLDLICRAHQVVQEGYEFFHNKNLVTIFSAPNYCGQFDNNGAVMNVDQNLKCSFKIFESLKKTKK